MTNLQCIHCGEQQRLQVIYHQNFSAANITPTIFSARRTTEHWHYTMVRCRNCSQLFAKQIFDKEKLKFLYSGSQQTYNDELDNITNSYFNNFLPYTHHLLEKKLCIEIGCGSGFFLSKMLEFGFNKIIGVEPSMHAIVKAEPKVKSHIFQGFFEDLNIDTNSADLICSFQTLDHIINPIKFLEKCHAVLKKNGIVYFITHNERSMQSLILGEKSPIIDVEHIYLFNKKTLKNALVKSGFTVIDTINIKNTYTLNYWLRMTPLPFKDHIRLLLKKYLNKNISLRAGNIGIIAFK